MRPGHRHVTEQHDWWAKLRDQGGFMTNIYIDDPATFLAGVPVC